MGPTAADEMKTFLEGIRQPGNLVNLRIWIFALSPEPNIQVCTLFNGRFRGSVTNYIPK